MVHSDTVRPVAVGDCALLPLPGRGRMRCGRQFCYSFDGFALARRTTPVAENRAGGRRPHACTQRTAHMQRRLSFGRPNPSRCQAARRSLRFP
jgi:hypothetical protein